MAEAIAALGSTPSEYVSNQSVTVTVNGITSTGIGEAKSIVSQAAADRVATRIAERLAEVDVMAQLPATLSAGLE
jgi:phosphoglucomutase